MIGFKDSTTNNTIATPAYVDISDGTAAANVLSPGTTPPGNNAVFFAGTYWAPADYVASSTTTSPVYDIRAFKHVSVQCVGQTGSATTTFQVSNDPAFATFVNISLNTATPSSQNNQAASLTSVIGFAGSTQGYAYFRLSTAWVSGTTTIKLLFSSNAASPLALPQATQVINQSVATTGGWTTYFNGLLSNTAISIKASAGAIGSINVFNPAGAVTYIQVFNVLVGSVTLGTTPPTASYGIAAGASRDIALGPGATYGTAIVVAATTTYNGSTAPGTAAVINVQYV